MRDEPEVRRHSVEQVGVFESCALLSTLSSRNVRGMFNRKVIG